MHLLPILDVMYEYMRPGTLTLILAVVAAVTALPMVADAMKNRWWLHALAVIVFFSIAAVEIMIIRHAAKSDEERVNNLQKQVSATVSTTAEIQRTLTGYIGAQTLVAQVQAEKQRHHKVSDELMELKGRAAKLSANIFEMLFLRTQMAPTQGRESINPQDFQQYAAKASQFDKETVLWYQEKYGTDARRVVEDLKNHGLEDAKLETAVQRSFGVRDIEIVATHLSAQAERITPEGVKPLTRLLYP